MKLDPLANPGGSPACVSKTFFIVVGLFCFVGFLVFLFFIIMLTAGFSLGVLIPFFLIFIAFSVYFWVLLIRLRGNMRHQFEIPGSCCGDFCTIYCCGICSTIQMARHTHDEKDYKYQCCNTTGLPPDAPQVV
jgi:Cys-rich protein (TIGR01571 family)